MCVRLRTRQMKTKLHNLTDDNEDIRRQLDRSQRCEEQLSAELERLRQEMSHLEIDLRLKTASLGQSNNI